MKISLLAALAALIACTAAPPAIAQDGAPVPVFARPGQSTRTILGTLRGTETDRYIFRTRRGQHAAVSLRATDSTVQFKLVDTRGRALHDSASTNEFRFETAMPSDGTYIVVIYQMRGADLSDRGIPYTLRVDLQGGESVAPNLPAAPSAASRSFIFLCGNAPAIGAVFTATNPATVDLTRNGRTLRATQALSASGARYVGANGLQFWNKGNMAQVDWPGERSTTCTVR